MNHPLSAGSVRRLVCWAATADALGVLLARAACLSYRLPVRLVFIKLKLMIICSIHVGYAIDRTLGLDGVSRVRSIKRV
jgi:hypothetical protein